MNKSKVLDSEVGSEGNQGHDFTERQDIWNGPVQANIN